VIEASALDIAPASAAEVELFADWAAAEGWNPGLADAAVFHAADPGGFLLGRLDGDPIASISLVRYGAGFAFLGFYIVRPEFRGRGFGLRMWHAAIDLAGRRTVGLDGVVAQQANYERSGFAPARRNVRYEGPAGGTTPTGAGVVPLAEVPFDDVAVYDEGIFPAQRRDFLRAWLAMPGVTALGILAGGRLAGYGVVRPCRTGSKVGPLFADHASAAEALLAALRTAAAEGPVFVDVPETNADAVGLVSSLGFQPMFETARMYRGRPPIEPVARIFGVTTVELG
jgi:GNAT superfamily N-acetyltransferase